MKRKILVETPHCAMLEQRFKKDGKKFMAIVTDRVESDEVDGLIQTKYDGETLEDLEQVIHKVWLNLMTNLHNGITSPIKIEITENDI